MLVFDCFAQDTTHFRTNSRTSQSGNAEKSPKKFEKVRKSPKESERVRNSPNFNCEVLSNRVLIKCVKIKFNTLLMYHEV